MSRRPVKPAIPPLNGVSPSCVALPSVKPAPWATVVDYLAHRMPAVSREGWLSRIALGQVFTQNGEPLAADAPFRAGERVYYYREWPSEQVVPFEESVLFQDEHLVVAEKPHFLPVTPGGRFVQQTLLVRLQRRLNLPQLSPLHRIDRETAGLVLFSAQPHERGTYQALFSGRAIEKTYEAIAAHSNAMAWPQIRRSRLVEHPIDFFRMVETEAGPPNSETTIALLEQRGAWARYQLNPISGKRHQLRVHMNALGLPIVGDQFYPSVKRGPDEAEDFATPLRLLAKGVAFTDPVTGARRSFQSRQSLAWPDPA
jgi:tRNA pseudouridine32 synthase / 23S rRNA pseudouridine746 synthase